MEAPVNNHQPPNQRIARLFRNGRNQAVRIPVEFEMPGDEVLITREGGRLIIAPHPVRKPSFLDVIRDFGPLAPEDDFPDVDDTDLPPPREIEL